MMDDQERISDELQLFSISMQCLSSRLDDISAFIKEGKIND